MLTPDGLLDGNLRAPERPVVAVEPQLIRSTEPVLP